MRSFTPKRDPLSIVVFEFGIFACTPSFSLLRSFAFAIRFFCISCCFIKIESAKESPFAFCILVCLVGCASGLLSLLSLFLKFFISSKKFICFPGAAVALPFAIVGFRALRRLNLLISFKRLKGFAFGEFFGCLSNGGSVFIITFATFSAALK